MDFFVVYVESGKTGTCTVCNERYDILEISREERREHPGIDVRCIIPMTQSPSTR